MGKQHYDVMRELALSPSQARPDREAYHHYVWFAIDRNDWHFFTNAVKTRDWRSLEKRYGHY